MKSEAKSIHLFEVRLWSKEHYKDKDNKNIYDGHIIDCKDRKSGIHHFKTPAQMLKVIEMLYKKQEKLRKKQGVE